MKLVEELNQTNECWSCKQFALEVFKKSDRYLDPSDITKQITFVPEETC